LGRRYLGLFARRRLRSRDRIVFAFPGRDQRDQHVEPIALCRSPLRAHQALDLFEGTAIVPSGLNWCHIHRVKSSDRLRVNLVVLPVRRRAAQASNGQSLGLFGAFAL